VDRDNLRSADRLFIGVEHDTGHGPGRNTLRRCDACRGWQKHGAECESASETKPKHQNPDRIHYAPLSMSFVFELEPASASELISHSTATGRHDWVNAMGAV
jgi:hypothetical protein